MNHLCIRGKRRNIAGHTIVETRPNGDQQVAALHSGNSRDRAVHAGHAHVQLVGIRERSQRHESGHHGNARVLGKLLQLFVSIGLDYTAADIKHGLLGLGNEPHGLLNLAGVWGGHRTVARQFDLWRPHKIHLSVLNILRHIHQHSTWTSRRCHIKRLRQSGRNIVWVGDHEIMFSHWQGNAADVRLLERVGSQQRVPHLASDGHHGDGVKIGVGDGCDQVGRAGS